MEKLKIEIDYLEEFRDYLISQYSNKAVIRDHISRCRRVNIHEGKLLTHYQRDKGKSFIERLTYSRNDMFEQKRPLHIVEIKGNKGFESIYEGTQVLQKSVKVYFDFLRKLH